MNEGQFLWMLLIVLGQLVSLAATLYGFRRKPPISEEIYRDYLRTEVHAAMCREKQVAGIAQFESMGERIHALDHHNTETHIEIFKAIRLNQIAVQEDFKTLERGLGRVEGTLTKIVKGVEQ
jgi:hypothetical protein